MKIPDNFKQGKCTCCSQTKTIEETIGLCYDCLGELRSLLRTYEHQQKGGPILEANRGKWYFSFDGEDDDDASVAFTPIAYWEKENSFCYYHYLSESEQEYLDYAVDRGMGLMDELNFELNCTIEEARQKFLKLGMIELTDLN